MKGGGDGGGGDGGNGGDEAEEMLAAGLKVSVGMNAGGEKDRGDAGADGEGRSTVKGLRPHAAWNVLERASKAAQGSAKPRLERSDFQRKKSVVAELAAELPSDLQRKK